MFMPPHSNSPYTGVHQPSPYSPESLLADGGWRTLVGQVYAADFVDPDEDSPEADLPLPRYAGIINAHHADNLEERDTVPPTVWTDDDTRRDPEKDGLMVPLQKLTAETLHDTSVTTAEYLYAPSTLHVERGRVSGASLTLPGGGMGKIHATPLPSGHRVEEVTLEVPVSHDKLSYALAAVENVIAGRRAFGYTIPEESRTVTTVGNEIVIRWEEHS